MSSAPCVMVLTVPAELTLRCSGLALDIGGSVAKVVYRTKEDLKEASESGATHGRLRLVSFTAGDLESMIEYVKSHAELTPGTDDVQTTLYTTGVGCSISGKLIRTQLNVKLENLVEFDCFIRAFCYLTKHLPRGELLESSDDSAVTTVVNEMMAQMTIIQESVSSGETNMQFQKIPDQDFRKLLGCARTDSPLPLAEAEEIYPCMMAMCGSGFGFMQINKDGTFKIIDASNRGGRAFLGLGTLLTQCESFEELIELASKGNRHNVDTYSDTLMGGADEDDESIYGKSGRLKTSALIYCFGQACLTKKKFSREDLAASLLGYLAVDLAQCVQLMGMVHGIKHVFFCGSTCNTSVVRAVVTEELLRRIGINAVLSIHKAEPLKFDFIRPGAHLGALGAMINGVEKFVKK